MPNKPATKNSGRKLEERKFSGPIKQPVIPTTALIEPTKPRAPFAIPVTISSVSCLRKAKIKSSAMTKARQPKPNRLGLPNKGKRKQIAPISKRM
ncbi:MAG: hypothetical protein EBT02_17490 [Planctomycetia bacterium]|nr:hypothetical protein [Planctomycetia bacterium]